jgi:formate dehydrogenase subunit delta
VPTPEADPAPKNFAHGDEQANDPRRPSRSKTPDLIRMANQIAANYAHHPGDQAAREVATHLRSFWTPAMRSDLTLSLMRTDSSAGELHPAVVSALRLLQSGTD